MNENDKKPAISITLKRQNMDIVMDIKTAPEIEDFFRKASLQVDNGSADNGDSANSEGRAKTSRRWFKANGEGLEYYVKNVKLSDKVNGYSIMDNFGNGLIEDDKINLAFLRVVGISNGVSIRTTELLSLEEMKDYIQRLANWTRDFYRQHLSQAEIIATVNVERENETLASVAE